VLVARLLMASGMASDGQG